MQASREEGKEEEEKTSLPFVFCIRLLWPKKKKGLRYIVLGWIVVQLDFCIQMWNKIWKKMKTCLHGVQLSLRAANNIVFGCAIVFLFLWLELCARTYVRTYRYVEQNIFFLQMTDKCFQVLGCSHFSQYRHLVSSVTWLLMIPFFNLSNGNQKTSFINSANYEHIVPVRTYIQPSRVFYDT